MAGYPIQKLTFSGMLDQSFRLMRDHFVALTVPFVVAYVPYTVGMDLIGMSEMGTMATNLDLLLQLVWKFLILLTAFMVVATFSQLVVMNVVADCYLSRPVSLGDATRRSLRTFLPYVGTSLIYSIMLLPLILLIITIPLAFYYGVRWMLMGAVIVVEKQYGMAALKRSAALITGHFWESFALVLVAGLLVGMASGALSMLFQFIPVVGPALNGIVSAITASYMSAVMIVLYVDLRCRHEHFDLQLLAQQVAPGSAPEPPAPAPAAAP